jgi:hypothetical protein
VSLGRRNSGKEHGGEHERPAPLLDQPSAHYLAVIFPERESPRSSLVYVRLFDLNLDSLAWKEGYRQQTTITLLEPK